MCTVLHISEEDSRFVRSSVPEIDLLLGPAEVLAYSIVKKQNKLETWKQLKVQWHKPGCCRKMKFVPTLPRRMEGRCSYDESFIPTSNDTLQPLNKKKQL
jgi:hypothetical protein